MGRPAPRQRGPLTFQLQHLRDCAVIAGNQKGKGELNVGQPDVRYSLGGKEMYVTRVFTRIHTHTRTHPPEEAGTRGCPPRPTHPYITGSSGTV